MQMEGFYFYLQNQIGIYISNAGLIIKWVPRIYLLLPVEIDGLGRLAAPLSIFDVS